MSTLKLSFFVIFLMFNMNQAFAQKKSDDAIAEAAGAYLGSVYMLKAVKQTHCGYALLMNIEDYSQKAERDVQSYIPPAYKNELRSFFASIQPEAKNIVANNIKALDGKIDQKTQCGLVVGALLGNLTQFSTAWERAKR